VKSFVDRRPADADRRASGERVATNTLFVRKLAPHSRPRRAVDALRSWFDSDATAAAPLGARRVDWARLAPFAAIHAGAGLALWVGVSWFAVVLCAASYAVRMFGITAFYHRGLAHRAFRAPRLVRFVGAVLANAAAQRGPLWWVAHHRRHHQRADTIEDVHSPVHHGFWWSHLGWWTDPSASRTDRSRVRDLACFPELCWLDRFDTVVPIAWAAAMFGIGLAADAIAPGLGTSGGQCLVWGFFVSTVLLYHATFLVNSAGHRFGTRRHATRDHSRNNAFLALLTMGEGWHNNHHRVPGAARQGFLWWELDISYLVLRLLERVGLVSELRAVPLAVRRPETGGGPT
jgi:stearoyl-CoA desaturase (delta-9 desaturase)